MRLLLATIAAALLAALLATVAAGSAGAGGQPALKNFKLPGGKVTCLVIGSIPGSPGGALCIATLNPGVRPFPKPNCHGTGDPGGGLQIGVTGRAKGLCLSEYPFSPPIVKLRYGKGVAIGKITCRAVSVSIGVRCTNGKHGFRMSPSGWARF